MMLEVALFGAGRIGKIHAGNLARRNDVKLKYVIDINAAAASELAARYGAGVGDVETAVGDPAIRAVVIASSTDTHAELILRAAAAGKAIFCEKPVDLSLARARSCAQAVHEAGVPCLIGFQRRYDPTFAAAKARLDAGEIGEPEMLVVTSRDPSPPPVGYIKSSGGIFKDMLIHDFDICRWILDDEAASVYAVGSCLTDPAIAAAGDADSAAVTIRTRKGRLCQINATRRAVYGYDQRFEVLGSRGMLRGTPIRTNLEDGLKALELAEAATQSWREGRPVTFDDRS
jgi:myo-inositol 2-dehydrogenase/D-chiro-inositol 1-dehydrogenase